LEGVFKNKTTEALISELQKQNVTY